jgi:hypothetical protein
MKRRSLLSAIVFVAACGGASSSKTDAAPTADATPPDAAPPPHNVPPAPGAMHAADGTTDVTFAISKIYLGDTDPDGTPDMVNGWKHFGYDIDGKISTAASTDLCKTQLMAAAANIYPDGDEGTDNGWGKNVLPIILGIASDASTKINDSIAAGKWTIMFTIGQLGSGTDYNPLSGHVDKGDNLGMSAKFDGTDVWPLVNGATPITLTDAYMTGGTWVSGQPFDSLTLNMLVSGFTLPLVIHHAVVSMVLDPTHQHAAHGVISGVLVTTEAADAIKQVAGSFDPSLCSGATIDSIVSQITQASDIMQDGTQDPTKTCDGISIGLGFDAEVVKLGPTAPPVMPPPPPCP